MNTTILDPTSPRHNEQAFRFYEPHIADIVNAWPHTVEFNPSNSVETFSARLRDAIKGLLHFRYSTTISMPALSALVPNLVVAIRNGKVVAGNRDDLSPQKKKPKVETRVTTVVHGILEPTEDQLRAIAILLDAQILDCTIEVKATPQAIQGLQSVYDFYATENPGGTYVLS